MGDESITRKQVREGAANKLGCDPSELKAFKAEIKTWVNEFTEEQEDSEEEAVGKKRKRSATPKKSGDWTENKGEYWMNFGKRRRITLRKWRGTTYVDVREFYEDRNSGEMKPGKKGISFNLDAWEELKSK